MMYFQWPGTQPFSHVLSMTWVSFWEVVPRKHPKPLGRQYTPCMQLPWCWQMFQITREISWHNLLPSALLVCMQVLMIPPCESRWVSCVKGQVLILSLSRISVKEKCLTALLSLQFDSTPEVPFLREELAQMQCPACLAGWYFRDSKSGLVHCLRPQHPSLTPVLQCLWVPRELICWMT